MPFMSLASSQDVFDAATHLPPGALLVIHDFEWQQYEQLLEAIGDRPGFRVSYDNGRLEIVSPSQKHDRLSRAPDLFVAAFCEVHGIDFQMFGSATWKSKSLNKGVEPDACYYVRNVERVMGLSDIRLDIHPPPDIAVEIDITNSSVRKFAIYAALGVPELWRYNGNALTFYSLRSGEYTEVPASSQLPGLSGAMLLEAIADSQSRGSLTALKAFRRRLRAAR